jgi:transcriptional regulator EpsA
MTKVAIEADSCCVTRPSKALAEPLYELLFAVTASACTINTHLDFYNWLQNEVREFIPHDMLLVAWGNFERGELSYDVSSSLPEFSTQSAYNLSGLEALLGDFFRHAQKTDRDWCLLRDIDPAATSGARGDEASLQLTAALSMRSNLVYTMRDKRESHDCMYVFSSRNSVIDIDPLVLDFLIPHVDSALRKLECLLNTTEAHPSRSSADVDSLSDREREVLHWVGMGKSNEEIGAILCISHNTVKNHLKRVFSKMGVSARSQAVQVYSEFNGRTSSAA